MRAWFLNLGPSTTTEREANADIKAMLATEADLVMGCEAIEKGPLPEGGKDYLRIRDTSVAGRANIFAYVRSMHKASFKWHWTDCNQEFPRDDGPGMHWPRSILNFDYHHAQIVVAHKPPLWPGAARARAEHDTKLVRIMNPGDNGAAGRARSRMLFWDSNGLTGAENLANKVDGRVVGDKIDNTVVRKVKVTEHDYRLWIGKHHFATDHPWGALWVQFRFMEDGRP
jgi:hypothetical protein